MRRARLALAAAVATGLLLAPAATAAAQEGPPATAPSSTAPVDPSSTTSTSTVPGGPADGQPSGPTTLPVDDPAAHGDAPPETVPPVDVTIPPREIQPGSHYAGQGSFAEHPGRLVRVSARNAEANAAESQAILDAAVARRDALAARQAELRAANRALRAEERRAIADLEQALVDLERRAADAYIRGGANTGRELILSADAGQYAQRVELLQVVVEADENAVRRYRAAREAVDEEQADIAEELAEVTRELEAAEQAVLGATLAHEIASRELAVYLAGGELVIHGFVFPVADPHTFGDSFGAPRMMGTEYQHWHEGTDIFAPMGTELLACERGVVTRVKSGGVLGGNTVWLVGESGTAYYYAHLSGFVPGLEEGMVVEAGTVIGYVGDTGNARGTSPHLHFEVHPDGGEAINPAPILVVADEQPQPLPIRLPGTPVPPAFPAAAPTG